MPSGYTSAVQRRPDDLLAVLTADVQLRYEPNFAVKSAVSAMLALPGLRACWPLSCVDYQAADQAKDVAGGGYHLTNNNAVVFDYANLIPYAEFTRASSMHLSRADGGAGNWADILGTEAFIGTPGLAMGGWFYRNDVSVGTEGLMSKRPAINSGYAFYGLNTGAVQAAIGSGAAQTTATSTTLAGDNEWHFYAMRFIPSTSVSVWIDDNQIDQATAIAAINDNTDAFEIGEVVGGNYLDGRASLCWLCASALSDAIIGCLFQQQRAMFNV